MRRKKSEIRCGVNGDLELEFCERGLASYAGLELMSRYLRRIRFNGSIRQHLAQILPGGDYGSNALIRVVMGMLMVGGRRLSHLAFLKGESVLQRFCELSDLPAERTMSNWLKEFRTQSVEALRRLNADLVARVVGLYLRARTLTIDVYGTVLSTGHQVAWVFRGYNPHHRKVPSYFPISAYLAESGHILRVQNRPGNVNDGKASITFLRQLFQQVQETLGNQYRLRFRMDGDFFKRPVLDLTDANRAGYAIKVPFRRCLDLQAKIRARKRWRRVQEGVDGFFTRVTVSGWKREFRVAIYRKRVFHKTRKNYQLDLFDPSDGTWEYSAVASNLSLKIRHLWRFVCGRGTHEKAIGELKTGLALDTIPTKHYGADSAWQQLVILTHNLLTSFQIETGAHKRPRSPKRTTHWILNRARTSRFEIFNRAGRLVRPHGQTILRLPDNIKTKQLFTRIADNLVKVA